MVKVDSCRQLMPRHCNVVTTSGLSCGQAIGQILREPHLPDSYYCYFYKVE